VNCQLPETGSGVSLLIVAVALVAVGAVIVMAVRLRVPQSVPVVLAVAATSIGAVAMAGPAEATSECPTTTAPTTAFVGPSSDLATTTTAGLGTTTLVSTTTTDGPTTTTDDVFVACATAAGFLREEFLFELENGFGTATLYRLGSGCEGEGLGRFLVGNSNVVDPMDYCLTNADGVLPLSAEDAGPWTPPVPDGLFICSVEDVEIPPITEAPTTTTQESTTTTEASTTTTSTTPA